MQLRHFVTLAREGSFARAAEALHITQPALSRSIKALEDELGQLLFDRIGKKIALTAYGDITLRRSHPLLEGAEELRHSGRKLARNDRGRIRLGLSSGPGALLTAPLLAHFGEHFPHFHVEISRGRTDTLTRLLMERALDAVLVDARSLVPSPELKMDPWVETPGAFMCRPDHPLLSLRRVTMKDLMRYPVASTPLSDELARVLVARYGEQAHPHSMVNLSSDEIAYLVHVAQHSNAVLLAIRAAGEGLVEVPLQPPLDTGARFALVTVASRAEAPFLAEVRKVMASVFAG